MNEKSVVSLVADIDSFAVLATNLLDLAHHLYFIHKPYDVVISSAINNSKKEIRTSKIHTRTYCSATSALDASISAKLPFRASFYKTKTLSIKSPHA